mgnify:CR=1 FL=1
MHCIHSTIPPSSLTQGEEPDSHCRQINLNFKTPAKDPRYSQTQSKSTLLQVGLASSRYPPPFTLPQLPPSCFNLGLLDLALRPFLHLLSCPVAQLLTWLLVGASRTKLPPFPSSTARSMPGLFPPWGLITPLWAAAFLLRPVPWPLPISFPCLLPLPGLALTSRWHGGASCSLRALF